MLYEKFPSGAYFSHSKSTHISSVPSHLLKLQRGNFFLSFSFSHSFFPSIPFFLYFFFLSITHLQYSCYRRISQGNFRLDIFQYFSSVYVCNGPMNMYFYRNLISSSKIPWCGVNLSTILCN